MLKLIIEDDEGRKTVVPFVRDEITIGRQEGNTIRLTERNVSRRHARLLRSNGSVVVEDLGSYNGIRINGEKVAGRANVADGDLIQIGDYDLAIQQEAQAGHPAHTPPPPPDLTPPPHNGVRANGAPHHEEPTETAAPAYVEEAEPISDEGEIPAPPPARPRPSAAPAAADNADSRRQATSIIRVDQIEAQRNRDVADLDPEDAPRLVVLNTEYAGREFACIRTELRIGRTDDNDINLDHRSLSRTHAKLVREANGEWRVIDMQSANGLTVNGEPYAQATLNHLDTIELGHLKMKFVAAGESWTYVPGKEDQPGGAAGGKSKTPLIIGGAAVVALLAAVGVFVAIGRGSPKDEKTPVTVTPPVARPDPLAKKTPVKAAEPEQPKPDPAEVAAAEAKKAVESAATALDERDLESAIATLERAKKLPNIDKASLTTVEDLLDKAHGEELMQQRLTDAEKALSAGKLDEAQKLLEDAASTEMFADRHQALSDTLAAKQEAEEKKKAAVVAARATEKTPERTPEKKDPPKPDNSAAESMRLFEEGKRQLGARQVREAKASLLKCVDVNPRFAQCHLLLGAAYAKLNESDAGAKHYEIFLKLAPDAPEAPRVRMMLEQYKGLKK